MLNWWNRLKSLLHSADGKSVTLTAILNRDPVTRCVSLVAEKDVPNAEGVIVISKQHHDGLVIRSSENLSTEEAIRYLSSAYARLMVDQGYTAEQITRELIALTAITAGRIV